MPANQIGKTFERQIVNDIRRAFKAKSNECFRTPMSGGHHALPGVDIQMSSSLFKRFPYLIECKSDKTFHAALLLKGSLLIEQWAAQVLKAAAGQVGNPLLVLNQKRVSIFAAVPYQHAKGRFLRGNYMVFDSEKERWACFLWPEFLNMAKNIECKGT